MQIPKIQGKWKGVTPVTAWAGPLGLILGALGAFIALLGILFSWTWVAIVGGTLVAIALVGVILGFSADKQGRTLVRYLTRSEVEYILLDVPKSSDTIIAIGGKLAVATMESPATQVSFRPDGNMMVDNRPTGQASSQRVLRLAKGLGKLAGEPAVAIAVFPGMESDPAEIPLPGGMALLVCNEKQLAGAILACPSALVETDNTDLVAKIVTDGIPVANTKRSGQKKRKQNRKRPKRK